MVKFMDFSRPLFFQYFSRQISACAKPVNICQLLLVLSVLWLNQLHKMTTQMMFYCLKWEQTLVNMILINSIISSVTVSSNKIEVHKVKQMNFQVHTLRLFKILSFCPLLLATDLRDNSGMERHWEIDTPQIFLIRTYKRFP